MGQSSENDSSVTGGTGGDHVLDYLANFIENSLDAIVAYDSHGWIVFWNLSAERTFGWTAREALGKSSRDLFWPAYTLQEQEDLRQRKLKLDAGEIVQGEHIMQRKDGALLWVKHSTHAILENGSLVSGYVAVYRDITERKQAEGQLRATLESIGDGFIACDADWRFIYVNAPAERILRIKREEVLGSSHWEVFPLTLGTELEREYRRAASGEIRDFENFYEPWGRWFHHRCFPREGGGISVYFEDITERKQADEILHRFQLLSEHSRDIILFVRREDGRILDANAAAVQAYGYTRDELLGLTIKDLRTYNTHDLIEEQFAQAEAGGILFETVNQRKDGSTFPVEVSSTGAQIGGVRTLVHIVRDNTERKQTEEQLALSNQRLNEILVSIQDDFYVLDRDWKFVFASRSFTSKVGKEPQDFVGNNIWEMFPKHVGGVLYENFHTAMEKREVRRFEIPGKYTDAWYRMTAFPSEEGITVLGTDITDRKRADEQLHYQGTLLSNVNDAVIASDAQFRITAWNSAAESMYGWRGEEVIGRMGLDIIRTEWPEIDANEMRRTIAETGRWRGEATQMRKDGSRFPVEVSSIVLHDDVGQISGYVSVNRDISERKQAEAALRESEERYRQLVKHAPAGIYEIDIKTMRFIEVNDTMCEILGYPRAELLSLMPEELLDEEGRGRFRQRMLQTLAGEKVSEQTEYRVRAKDGREIWAILTTTTNYENGKPRSVSVIAHDVTERKQMEREIESMARFPMENPNPVLRIYRDGSIAFANAASDGLLRLWNRAVGEPLPEGEYQLALQALESATPVEQEVDCAGRIYSLIFTPIAEGGYINIYGRDITERKRAEETLTRQRELLQRVFENIPVLLVMWDPNLRQFALNHHAETVLGWTTAEANEGDFMTKVYPDPLHREEVSAFMQSLAGGFRELLTTTRNGEHIPIDWANIRLTDNTMVGIGVDLRERKQVEQSLRAKTEEINTLLQVSPIAFFVSQDPECKRITANPAGYRLVKLPQDPTQNISKSAPVEEQPAYRVFRDGVELDSQDLPMQKAARLGMDVVEESLELRFEDGSSKYIYSYARPLIGENNRSRGAIAAMLDITERKQAEEQIRASEERFRNLANTVPSIVWTADPDGMIIYTNEYWHTYTGSSTEETNWIDFLHPDDLERAVSAWTTAIRTGKEYFVETRLRRSDGQHRWFQARALPVRDGMGNIVAWYGVSTDIHDRIEAIYALRDSQQQLQFLNESLEQKVREQTAEMRRLTANLTKAEQRERSRIAHILHDDLQQRLYAVKLRLALLTDRHSVDEAVEKEVAELDKQLAEILLLTRHLTIEMSPPVLRDEGLRQAIEWLAFQMDEKLGMRVEVQAEESFTIADEAIQVLLFNCVRELLFNIVKHAGVNRAVVSLQRTGDHLRIEVWDDGKGFDVAGLFRNNKDNLEDNEEVKATFGLPTLRHQLGLLGGQMEIKSEPGAGTRITLTIPYS